MRHSEIILKTIIPLGLSLNCPGWASSPSSPKSAQSQVACSNLLGEHEEARGGDDLASIYAVISQILRLNPEDESLFLNQLSQSKSSRERFDAHISIAIFEYTLRGGNPSDLFTDESFLGEVRVAYKELFSDQNR